MTTVPKSSNTKSLRWVVVPAATVFIAVVWWAGRGVDQEAPAAVEPISAVIPPPVDGPGREMTGAESGRTDAAPQSKPWEEADLALGAYVSGKYRFLFSGDLPFDAANKLRAALVERERVAIAINTGRQSSDPAARAALPRQQSELEEFDRKVGMLLRPADITNFEVLKNSDVEQFQLEDFAGGVSAVAPLSDGDRQAILYTKMVHRQRFRQVLADSRLMTGELNPGERRQAFAEVRRALEDSRDHYLQEVRQYLYNDEQFTLLRNYETTEFAAEIEKLRTIAGVE